MVCREWWSHESHPSRSPQNGRSVIRLLTRRLRAAAPLPVLILSLALVSCGNRDATLDPVLPDAVGGRPRTAGPPQESTGTWSFSASIETRRVQYGNGTGPGLTIHAFLFTTPTAASDTYETSRRNIKSGGGGFSRSHETLVAGVRGLRLSDAAGEYFEFRRGCWILVLDGSAELFEPALRAIRWEAAGR